MSCFMNQNPDSHGRLQKQKKCTTAERYRRNIKNSIKFTSQNILRQFSTFLDKAAWLQTFSPLNEHRLNLWGSEFINGRLFLFHFVFVTPLAQTENVLSAPLVIVSLDE